MMETKTYQAPIEFKSEDTGEFTAIFSTFNVIDKDGDVVVPGAIKDGEQVRIAYWGHRWQDLPVGRGVVRTDEEKAWIDGKFFLDTQMGKETYRTVKNLGDLQQWSYGFDIKSSELGKMGGESVRYLRDLELFEVSPVLLAASIGTGTVSMKAALGLTDEEIERLKALVKDDDGRGGASSAVADTEGDAEGEAGGDDGKPSGVPPRVVLTEIEIELLEA